MTWLFLASLVIIVVAIAIVRPGSRWFWVVFPATMIAVALAIGGWLPIHPTAYNFGWGMMAPADGHLGPWWRLYYGGWQKYVYPVVAVVGIGMSAFLYRARS